MLTRLRPSLVVIGIGLALAACVNKKSSSSGGGTPTVPNEDPVRIEVLPSSPAAENGGTVQLGVKAVYSNGAVEYIGASGARGDVTWTSADDTIATVDSAGIATGKAVGNVAITAAYSTKSAEKTLNVTPKVKAIQVFAPSLSVETGGSADYTVVALYEDHTAAQVTPEGVAIENGSLATVTTSSVGGVAAGTTTLTVTYHQRSAIAPVTVVPPTTPPTVTAIAITSGPAQLAKGTTGKFKATATYSDATTASVTADVTWTTSDDKVLTVEGGVVTAVGAGTATVKASLTVEGVATPFTDEKSVEVLAATLESLEITSLDVPGLTVLPLDVTGAFAATGTFTGGYTQDVTRDVTWGVGNASDTDTGVHAAVAGPGEITTSTGTVVYGFSPGDVIVTAELGSVTPAEYPLTIAGMLDTIVVTSDIASPAVGEMPVFTATGHYKDGATDLAFTSDLTARVAWFDSQTDGGLTPVSVVVDNTPGDEGQGFALASGTEDVTAYYHALVQDDTGTLVPFQKSGTLSVTVP